MTIKVEISAKDLEKLHTELSKRMIENWAHRIYPGFVRTVTVNDKRFVVRKDEHGEYYEPIGDAAPRTDTERGR